MNNQELDSLFAFQFSHRRYNYAAFDGHKAAVNDPSYTARLTVEKGQQVILVDTNCESHFIPFLARFIDTQSRFYGPPGWPTTWMLCRAEDNVPGTCKKGDYFLCQPKVRIQGHSDSGGMEIIFEFEALHYLGRNRNRKVKIRDEQSF